MILNIFGPPLVRLSDNFTNYLTTIKYCLLAIYIGYRTKSDNHFQRTLYLVDGPLPIFSVNPALTISSKSFCAVPFDGFGSNASV